MNESFHRKCGQRQDLHFCLICRLSRKLIPVASISLLFISTLTDCQRDFMRTKLLSICFIWKQSQFRGITQKKQHCFWHFILRANSHSWVGIYRLNHDPVPLISRKRWQGCASDSRIRLNSFLVTSRRFVIFCLVCYVPYLKKLTSPISQTGEPSVIVCISLAESHCKWYACMVTVLKLPIRILHYLENKANC